MVSVALMMVMNSSLKKPELKAEHQGTHATFFNLTSASKISFYI